MTTQQAPTKAPVQEPAELTPLSIRETLSILVAGHIGVRKATQRKEDFSRAKGVNIFFAALAYFSIIIFGLILLVRYIST
jgi:hypothetical protein